MKAPGSLRRSPRVSDAKPNVGRKTLLASPEQNDALTRAALCYVHLDDRPEAVVDDDGRDLIAGARLGEQHAGEPVPWGSGGWRRRVLR